MATYDRFAGVDDNYLFPPEVMQSIATASAFNNRFYTKTEVDSSFSLKSSVTAIGTRVTSLEDNDGLLQTRVTSLEDDSGLIQTRLGALEQDTGVRDITGLIQNYSGGTVNLRREGSWVHLTIYDLTFTSAITGVYVQTGLIPVGFRPSTNRYLYFAAGETSVANTPGPLRVDLYGGVAIYGAGGKTSHATGSWHTDDPFPLAPPGSPA